MSSSPNGLHVVSEMNGSVLAEQQGQEKENTKMKSDHFGTARENEDFIGIPPAADVESEGCPTDSSYYSSMSFSSSSPSSESSEEGEDSYEHSAIKVQAKGDKNEGTVKTDGFKAERDPAMQKSPEGTPKEQAANAHKHTPRRQRHHNLHSDDVKALGRENIRKAHKFRRSHKPTDEKDNPIVRKKSKGIKSGDLESGALNNQKEGPVSIVRPPEPIERPSNSDDGAPSKGNIINLGALGRYIGDNEHGGSECRLKDKEEFKSEAGLTADIAATMSTTGDNTLFLGPKAEQEVIVEAAFGDIEEKYFDTQREEMISDLQNLRLEMTNITKSILGEDEKFEDFHKLWHEKDRWETVRYLTPDSSKNGPIPRSTQSQQSSRCSALANNDQDLLDKVQEEIMTAEQFIRCRKMRAKKRRKMARNGRRHNDSSDEEDNVEATSQETRLNGIALSAVTSQCLEQIGDITPELIEECKALSRRPVTELSQDEVQKVLYVQHPSLLEQLSSDEECAEVTGLLYGVLVESFPECEAAGDFFVLLEEIFGNSSFNIQIPPPEYLSRLGKSIGLVHEVVDRKVKSKMELWQQSKNKLSQSIRKLEKQRDVLEKRFRDQVQRIDTFQDSGSQQDEKDICFTVELRKVAGSLGLSLMETEDKEIAIRSFHPLPDGTESKAKTDGELCVGDQILEIDGEPVTGHSFQQVVCRIKDIPDGAPVTLKVAGNGQHPRPGWNWTGIDTISGKGIFEPKVDLKHAMRRFDILSGSTKRSSRGRKLMGRQKPREPVSIQESVHDQHELTEDLIFFELAGISCPQVPDIHETNDTYELGVGPRLSPKRGHVQINESKRRRDVQDLERLLDIYMKAIDVYKRLLHFPDFLGYRFGCRLDGVQMAVEDISVESFRGSLHISLGSQDGQPLCQVSIGTPDSETYTGASGATSRLRIQNWKSVSDKSTSYIPSQTVEEAVVEVAFGVDVSLAFDKTRKDWVFDESSLIVDIIRFNVDTGGKKVHGKNEDYTPKQASDDTSLPEPVLRMIIAKVMKSMIRKLVKRTLSSEVSTLCSSANGRVFELQSLITVAGKNLEIDHIDFNRRVSKASKYSRASFKEAELKREALACLHLSEWQADMFIGCQQAQFGFSSVISNLKTLLHYQRIHEPFQIEWSVLIRLWQAAIDCYVLYWDDLHTYPEKVMETEIPEARSNESRVHAEKIPSFSEIVHHLEIFGSRQLEVKWELQDLHVDLCLKQLLTLMKESCSTHLKRVHVQSVAHEDLTEVRQRQVPLAVALQTLESDFAPVEVFMRQLEGNLRTLSWNFVGSADSSVLKLASKAIDFVGSMNLWRQFPLALTSRLPHAATAQSSMKWPLAGLLPDLDLCWSRGKAGQVQLGISKKTTSLINTDTSEDALKAADIGIISIGDVDMDIALDLNEMRDLERGDEAVPAIVSLSSHCCDGELVEGMEQQASHCDGGLKGRSLSIKFKRYAMLRVLLQNVEFTFFRDLQRGRARCKNRPHGQESRHMGSSPAAKVSNMLMALYAHLAGCRGNLEGAIENCQGARGRSIKLRVGRKGDFSKKKKRNRKLSLSARGGKHSLTGTQADATSLNCSFDVTIEDFLRMVDGHDL